MGSLLPGWDERMPGVPPREMEDYNDYEEVEGYFARLERLKSLRHAGSGSPPGSPHGPGSMIERRSSATAASVRAVLSRQASLPADWRPADPRAHPASPRTPLASSLGSSGPASPPEAAKEGRLDVLRSRRDRSRAASKYSWWDKLGSSSLNEKPDEEEDHTHAYVPQFEVTGQGLHYRTTVTLEEDETPTVVHAAA